MKKIFNYILIALCVSSCNYYGEDDEYKATEPGHIVYQELEMALMNISREMEFMQKIDTYLQAPDQATRDSVLFYILSSYRIFESNNNIMVNYINQNEFYEITRTDTKPINETGAKWAVLHYYQYENNHIDTIAASTIENKANNSWIYDSKFKYTHSGDLVYDLKVNITKTTDNSFANYYTNNDYSYSSTGSNIGTILGLDNGGKLLTEYQIEKNIDMSCREHRASFIRGKVSMKTEAYKNKNSNTPDITDNIIAEIISPDEVEITFRDITETWGH